MSGASGLNGLLEPLSRCLDDESARRVADHQIDPTVQARIDALAERANEGTLSDNERPEYPSRRRSSMQQTLILKPMHSEKFLEMAFSNGKLVRTVSQFGEGQANTK